MLLLLLFSQPNHILDRHVSAAVSPLFLSSLFSPIVFFDSISILNLHSPFILWSAANQQWQPLVNMILNLAKNRSILSALPDNLNYFSPLCLVLIQGVETLGLRGQQWVKRLPILQNVLQEKYVRQFYWHYYKFFTGKFSLRSMLSETMKTKCVTRLVCTTGRSPHRSWTILSKLADIC